MNNRNAITRRTALVGALMSTVALALPLGSRATAATSPSPIADMLARFQDARSALDAANATYEVVWDAFAAENEANPIMVHLPGFRFGHGAKTFTSTSPAAIREFYAVHYGMLSGKSGAIITRGVPTMVDYSADQARDLGQALANWDAGAVALNDRRQAIGLPAVEEPLDQCCDALDAAWLALLTYVPQSMAEVSQKASAVLAIATAEPVQFDEKHAALFLHSLVRDVG